PTAPPRGVSVANTQQQHPEVDGDEDDVAAGEARGARMLRDLKDLVQGRTGPVDQADENLVPNAAANGGQREQPGTAVQQENHQDGRRRDHRPARAARPAKEWKQRSEGSQVDRLY